MYKTNLKLYVSIFIILSHAMIFFLALLLDSHGAFDTESSFSVLGALIPLFGLFLTIVIKDTLANKHNLHRGQKVNVQMVFVTASVCLFYLIASLTTFYFFYEQTIVTANELSDWIARIEAAFGVGLGLIVDDLFGGDKKP